MDRVYVGYGCTKYSSQQKLSVPIPRPLFNRAGRCISKLPSFTGTSPVKLFLHLHM